MESFTRKNICEKLAIGFNAKGIVDVDSFCEKESTFNVASELRRTRYSELNPIDCFRIVI